MVFVRSRKTRERKSVIEAQSRRDRNSKVKFDEKGLHIKSGRDLCDCLLPRCDGCFLPCPGCKSLKCGHSCRRNRTWEYEAHIMDGAIRESAVNRFKS